MTIFLKYKIKPILFSFIFMYVFFLGCTKNQSNTFNLSTSTKNYFLMYKGFDHNGFLNSSIEPLLKYFFKDKYGLFKMNYTVFPPIELSYNQDKELFQRQIIDISSKLDEDSTLIIYLAAHGGEFAFTQEHPSNNGLSAFLRPNHLVEALNKGLNGKRFKRFILWMESCFSGGFVDEFKGFEEIKNGKLFKEGIYIKSSDASRSTWELLGDSFAFFLLRNLQIQRCNRSEDDYNLDYQNSYTTMEKFFTEFKSLGVEYNFSRFSLCFSPDSKYLKKDPNFRFNDTPKFKDFENIIEIFRECLLENYSGVPFGDGTFNKNNYTKYITYSDENLRDSEIFPEICPKN